MTTQELKLNINNDSAFPEVLPNIIENYLPRMTTQEPKLNNKDSAFPKVLPNAIEDDAHHDHHPISTKNYLPRMITQEPKLTTTTLPCPRSTNQRHRRCCPS
jgi:hypothetical protein